MDRQQVLQVWITLVLASVFLIGCGGSAPTAISEVPTATPIPTEPPTATPTPVPPTAAAPTPIPTVEAPTQIPTVAPPVINLSSDEELVLTAGMDRDDPLDLFLFFGVEGEENSSPGPTIKVRKGETVTITFENMHFFLDGSPGGNHNFVIVADKDIGWNKMEPLWGAYVGGSAWGSNVEPGERGTVTFTAEEVGSFFYVCRIRGHIEFGMWGRFIVGE